MSEKLEDIELRSEEVQEILSQLPVWAIRWGNTIILMIILLLLFISWFIKYPDIITSTGVISTSIPPQKEFARSTGKLSNILVEDNQKVKVNQPLAIIENAARFKDVFYLKSILDTLSTEGNSFEYPIDSIPVLFLGDIESTFALFENSYIQYKLNKDLQPFSNEQEANRFSLSELRSRIEILKTQRNLNKAELAYSKQDLERNQVLFDKGVISLAEFEQKKLSYLQSERAFENMGVSTSQLQESLIGARKNSRGAEINRVKEEMVLLKGVLQSLNNLKKSIRDWELNYVLQSSLDGTVSFLDFWDESQSVTAGELVFTVLPDDEKSFVARLKTPVQNSGKLRIGQKVLIRIDNYPNTEFGVLEGTLDKISAIANDEGFYNVDVRLPEKLITTYNIEIDFKQEMIISADIVTKDLRLIERFFNQLSQLLRK